MNAFNAYLTHLLQQSPALGVAVMMNNYFHDVATAMLAASAFCLYAIDRTRDALATDAATLFFLKSYRVMVKFFHFALCWIVIGGVPRTVFFVAFEWNHFADKEQVPALAVKHILMATAVVWGALAWRRLKLKVGRLQEALPAALQKELATEES